MDISTEISSLRFYDLDFSKRIKLLKDCGFTAYDFSMFDLAITRDNNYKENAIKLREYADSIGIKCNQSHAPFPSARIGDEVYNEEITLLINRAIEISGILGAKSCVVHPVNDFNAQQNAIMYQNFIDVAKKYNVKICVENMWNWTGDYASKAACSHHDDFKKHLELLDSNIFVACLDIGHAEMKGLETTAVQMIKTLDKKLFALHIHDNDCHHDNHKLPYTGNIDFAPIITALKEVDYKGDITFEADTLCKVVPKELIPGALRFMADIGKYFKSEIENA